MTTGPAGPVPPRFDAADARAAPRSPLRRWSSGAATALAWTYLAVACALLALRVITGDRLWPVLVATHVAHLWLAPAPFVLLLALLRRSRRQAVPAALCIAALVHDCGPWLVPARETPASDERTELRVLTWNLGFDLAKPRLVEAEIRRMDPDLVVLQEPSVDVYAHLARRLGDAWPHHGRGAADRALRSKAWFSRVPLRRAEVATQVLDADGARIGVTELRAELALDLDGEPLFVDSVHASAMFAKLGRAWWEAPGYVALNRRAAARGASIVAGDFNTTERSPLYRDLVATGVIDAWRAAGAGPGFGFPSRPRPRWAPTPPLVRIDYLFHTPDLECVAVELGDGEGSDHRPLLGVFRRTREP